ncbi:recombinase family protein [bacterium]|nr:recombinase family protein [bacterium]
MITKISDMMNEVSSDINRLERELTIYENSTNWLDWLNQMYLEIDSVQSYDLNKKQKFLNDYINKIDVEYLPKVQSHKFDFEFKYPIVEDKIIKDGLDKSGKRKYQIDKGLNTSSLSLQIPNNHKSKLSEGEKDELNRVISKFRVEDSLSLNEISKRLNNKGYRTLTNKLWNKSNLSLYIKRMKVDVGK